jgi:hypothetical protein
VTFAKKETKEEFRRRLMQSRNSTSDSMVDSVVDFMIEMRTIEYEDVLDMPSIVFDIICQGLIRRAELEKKAYKGGNTEDTSTFG